MRDGLKDDIMNVLIQSINYHIDDEEVAHTITNGCIDELMDLINDKLDGCFTEN